MQHSLKNSCFGVSFRLKKEINDTAVKDARNLFRSKKEIDDTTVIDIKDISRLKKENEAVKDG